jgi:hypothetical protein
MNILPVQQFKPVVGQNASYADGSTSHYSRVELMFARESPVSINCLCIFWTYEADFVRLNTLWSQLWRYDVMISSMTLWFQVWRYDLKYNVMTLWYQVWRYDVGNVKIFHLRRNYTIFPATTFCTRISLILIFINLN